MPNEIDVRLERVTKMFADVAAVDDLSLDIEDGEFFSMLGPSGCGKTTTLRMIGGFEDPTYGTVYLGGRDVTDLPPYKRDVNTVFQSYALFPHLDVYENVAFGLRRKKVDKGELETRVKDAMTLVDLDRLREAQAAADVGRPAAAGRARARAGEPPEGAAARRAARRARPEAAQADAARAQAHPAGGRHHVHLRDPRPGRGHDDVRPARRDAARARSSSSAPPRTSTRTPPPSSWPGSSGRVEHARGRARRTGSNGVATVALRDGGSVRLPSSRVPSRSAGHREGRGAAREAHDLARRRRRRPAA